MIMAGMWVSIKNKVVRKIGVSCQGCIQFAGKSYGSFISKKM